jgi:HD-like signal output (HDOD) protein
MSRAVELVNKVSEVMTLPVVVRQVIDLTHDPKANAPKIAEAISKDPVMAAKILRTSNSSLFGFLSKTTDIGSAVVRLGVKQVRSVAVALSVGKMFNDAAGKDGYSAINVWKHSVAVGTMNESLTSVCSEPGVRALSGEALLAGLIHDIGIIVQAQYLPKKFPEVPPLAFALKESLAKIEEQTFGWNHAEVGGLVLKKWKFNDETVKAVSLHHGGPGLKDSLLGSMTAMSEILTARSNIGYADVHAERINMDLFGELQRRLGLMGPAMMKLKDVFTERVQEALEVFALESVPAGRA